MTIISRSELLAIPRYKTFAEARNAQASRKMEKPIVFLSHSHLDNALVLSAVALLKSHGSDVFVDWMDDGMPDVTSGLTATIIRQKIQAASRLVLLASPSALASRWVPWGLGYADANKGLRQVAILPVREDWTTYPGSEYLQIYPSIQTNESGDHVVAFPGEKTDGAGLRYWLGNLWGKVFYGPAIPFRES